MDKKMIVNVGKHKIVVIPNEDSDNIDYSSVDLYIQMKNGDLELISSIEDNDGTLRILAYNDLSDDDYTVSLDIKQWK